MPVTARQPSEFGKAKGTWLRAQVVLTLLLVLAWVLWSGVFTFLLLGFGALSCAFTIYMVSRMGYFGAQVFALRYNLRLLNYWVWLLREIVKSSVQVAGVVLAPRLQLNPEVVEIDAGDFEFIDQALLGNSITLTPGTLTLDCQNGRLLVHSLTPQGARSLREGEMKRRVAALRSPERG